MNHSIDNVEEHLKDNTRALTIDEVLVSLGVPITNMNRGILRSKLKYNKKIEHSYRETVIGNTNMYQWGKQ
ncbi:MAG: hypothetical protein ACRCVH_04865 [Vagococcus fluvialis]